MQMTDSTINAVRAIRAWGEKRERLEYDIVFGKNKLRF